MQAPLKTSDGTKVPDYVFYRDDAVLATHKNQVLTEAVAGEGAFAVGDAKYWDRPLDIAVRTKGADALSNKNPSYQIYFYMLHSGVEWGMLTNGKLWRLYHRESAHKLDVYYEVDLEELVRSGDIERFLYFYAFFRRGAFEPGSLCLSELLRASIEYAHGVSNTLKSQVYDALRHLAQGFLDYPGNGLTTTPETLKDAYNNALILLYRLIFILYAEARELLPVRESELYRDTYSLLAIKRAVARDLGMGKRLLPTSSLLWPRLCELFQAINLGSPPLKVATFNGGLFDPVKHPFLERYTVGDAHLQQAIDMLARVNGQFIDYRDLTVRHMGTIYEGLLEFKLVPISSIGVPPMNEAQQRSIGVPPMKEAFTNTPSLPNANDSSTPGTGMPRDLSQWSIDLVNDKGERKATGSYYTPDYIVKFIVEQTIGPVLWEAVSGKTTDAQIVRAVLNVNVLDPAMGSGHFLVEATEYIARFLVDYGILPEGKTAEEADLAFWKRRVVQSCVYGVDLNPLAVELAKLSLWLTTVAKDRPLSFLDHHLRPGNSLVDARLSTLQQHSTATAKAASKKRRVTAAPLMEETEQGSLFSNADFTQRMKKAVSSMWLIEESEADTVEQVKEQELLYTDLRRLLIEKYGRLADLLTAQHFGAEIPANQWVLAVDYVMGRSLALPPALQVMQTRVAEIAAHERFFHWELEFPELFFDKFGRSLGEEGGFEAVIGNPPWERIKLAENEFFASRAPAIALAPRASERKQLITALPESNPQLWQEYLAERTRAEQISAFMHNPDEYPLMGKGDTNYYAIFAEKALQMIKPIGRVGLLTPSGIATDSTTKDYFQYIVSRKMLAGLYDFENRKGIFPDVDSRFKITIILIAGAGAQQEQVQCGFFLHSMEDMRDPARMCTLSVEDFRLFNPNTMTCPIFRRCRDAELTRKIYQNSPVLINKALGDAGNPWGISFLRMFDMTNDSRFFHTAAELEDNGYWLGEGNIYKKGAERYVPLYESKMVHQYDHRYASGVAGEERLSNTQASLLTTIDQKKNPNYSSSPRFWVPEEQIKIKENCNYLLGFRDIARATDYRTCIATLLPVVGTSNKLPLLIFNNGEMPIPSFLANLNSIPFDYACRQKVSSVSLNFFIVEQFPVLPPARYAETFHGVLLADFIKERVLQLCYTAWDLRAFAEDMGYNGPPFPWDEETRLHLRCQLDALYFHLYGLTHEEAAEILDTFPIVQRQDEAAYGYYRTKTLILAYYNAYTAGNMDAVVKG